jgi:hypothetical protein
MLRAMRLEATDGADQVALLTELCPGRAGAYIT